MTSNAKQTGVAIVDFYFPGRIGVLSDELHSRDGAVANETTHRGWICGLAHSEYNQIGRPDRAHNQAKSLVRSDGLCPSAQIAAAHRRRSGQWQARQAEVPQAQNLFSHSFLAKNALESFEKIGAS